MMSHDSGMPLTDLCAICHVNPIKYTCPRDGIHTCSLPCVKRHKQWAQCSGIRNPAEYRKRSELATPASIDKDFNFITTVERSISKADEVVTDLGIDLTPARIRPNDQKPKYEVEAAAQNTKIVKAPKGLSRSKTNRTFWGSQTKCIVWTVEWLLQDGRTLMSPAPENKTVQELFDAAGLGKRHTRKRKRPAGVHNDPEDNGREGAVQQQATNENLGAESTSTLTSSETTVVLSPVLPVEPIVEAEPSISSTSAKLYFYLHRPNTQSRFKCLIPIDSSASLQEALKNKILLEYPTVYVRSDAPEQLESPFILEEEWERRYGTEIPIEVVVPLDSVVEEEDPEEGEVTIPHSNIPPDINELKVLEVLAKDLGS